MTPSHPNSIRGSRSSSEADSVLHLSPSSSSSPNSTIPSSPPFDSYLSNITTVISEIENQVLHHTLPLRSRLTSPPASTLISSSSQDFPFDIPTTPSSTIFRRPSRALTQLRPIMDNLNRSIIAPRNPSNPDPYEIFNEHCEQVLDLHLQPGHLTTTRGYYTDGVFSSEHSMNLRASTRQLRDISSSSQYTMMHGLELAYLSTSSDKTPLRQLDASIKSTLAQYAGTGDAFSSEEMDSLRELPPEIAKKVIQERQKADMEYRKSAAADSSFAGTSHLNQGKKSRKIPINSYVPYTLSPYTLSPACPAQATRLYRHPTAIIVQAGVEPGPTGTVELKAQARLSNRFSASAYVIGDGSMGHGSGKHRTHSVEEPSILALPSTMHATGESHYRARKNSHHKAHPHTSSHGTRSSRASSPLLTPATTTSLTSADQQASLQYGHHVANSIAAHLASSAATVRRGAESPNKIFSASLTAEGDLWNLTGKYSSDESVVGASGVTRFPISSRPTAATDFTLASRMGNIPGSSQASHSSSSPSSSEGGEIRDILTTSAKYLSRELMSSVGMGSRSSTLSSTPTALSPISTSAPRITVDELVAKHRLPYVEALDIGGEYLYSLESGGDQFSFGGRLIVSPERVRIISSRTFAAATNIFSSTPSAEKAREADAEEIIKATALARSASAEGEDADVLAVFRKLYERATSHKDTPSHPYNSRCLCLHCIRSEALLYRRTPLTFSGTVNGVGTAQLSATVPLNILGPSSGSSQRPSQCRTAVSARLQHSLASGESKCELGVSTIFTASDIVHSVREVLEYSEDGRNASTVFDAYTLASEIKGELENEYQTSREGTLANAEARARAENRPHSRLGSSGRSLDEMNDEEAKKVMREATTSVLGRGFVGTTASRITEEVAPALSRPIGWFSALKSYASRFTEAALWRKRSPVQQVCMLETPDKGWHQVRAAVDTRRGYNLDWRYHGDFFSLGLALGSRSLPDARLNNSFPPMPAGMVELNNKAAGKMHASSAGQSNKKAHRNLPPNSPVWNALPFDTVGFTISFGE